MKLSAWRENGRRYVKVSGKLPAWARQLPNDKGVFEATHDVLKAIRLNVKAYRPALSGGRTSVGFGDRTGCATPGHLSSLKGTNFFPILAQQSIREMTRTGRSPDDVMDDAVFGAIQAGWTRGFGADADHLKTAEDIDRTAAAGFTLFTLDVGEHIGKGVATMPLPELQKSAAGNPDLPRWKKSYLGKTFLGVTYDERTLLETVVKYGRAVQKAAELAKHARKVAKPCEIEMSVDETNEDTTEADHIFVAKELKARGVKIAAIAPKFVGSFEKGIDYKGDLADFEASLKRHAAIAKASGGHKISVHSGSDKFSLYPIVARACKGRFHLKTAGTSWLEALRAVCRKDPALFREICDLARARYEEDRKSYHISGRVEDVPPPAELRDAELEDAYLEDLGGRQILHVTYGSVFQSPLKARLFDVLLREEAEHWACVGKHLRRHVDGLRGKPTKAARELLSRS